MYKITLLTAAVLAVLGVIPQIVLANTTTLTETAGQSITLTTGMTGLSDDVYIIWSHGSKQRVLINFSDGKLIRNESQRYQVDRDTGSLTIGSLSVNDSGLYEGQVITRKRWVHLFNLNVVEADATPPTAAPPQTLVAHQRSHTFLIAPFSLFIVLLVVWVVLACRVRQKKRKGKCQDGGV